jgi:beta-N-acetylhexosaminidase
MSPAAIGGLLRSELGHAGLVISDCMEMNAITNGFTAADATCRAVAAGVDLVLWSHTLARQQAAVEALTDAAKSGLVPSHRLTDAYARVQALRKALTHDRAGLGRGASAGQRVDRIASAGSVFRRAITLVRDRDRVLPLRPGGPVLILSAGTGPRATALARAIEGLTDCMRAAGHAITGHCAAPGSDETALLAWFAAQASTASLGGGTVLLLTRDAAFDPWQAAALRPLLRASGRRAVLVATGLPDDVAVFPEAGCAICAFDDAGGALAALTEVMTGRAPAVGRLPVVLAS